MKLFQRFKGSTVANQAAIVSGILVAFGTVFYAFAAACQVSIMKQGTKDSSAQIERLVGATNSSIDKSVQASSKSVSDAIQKNKESIDDALQQNREELRASERQSKAALDASIDIAHNEERAWIVAKTGADPTKFGIVID